ncbi:hypothetical protein B9479_002515 [Cryptococcus floricola]|uniref:Phytanoyl-CoA dioxygenase n=1 Tax=Cryptococcus floricola TaxID=2591691 RepID=A0A5D3AZG8_9TREE|nr:hypothetical protein B9479_002515 [Cryptococcus floricola]
MAISQLTTIDASQPLDKIIEIIERDGGVIVANLLSPELLQKTMDAIEPHFGKRGIYRSKATHNELGQDFFPEGSQRIYGLLSKITEPIIDIVRLPVWQGVMSRFLNDEYFAYTGENLLPQKSGYMLATTAALRLVPGAKPQPLHRDQIAYQTRPEPSNPFFTPMLGCLIAGSRATKKNGATAVIPGSHLWPPTRAPKVEECAYAEMEPGSALFTLGSTYHGAGENKCAPEDPEAQDQEEILTTPIEIARTLPDDILRIAGYYKATGGVGYVEDHQDLVDFLKSEDSAVGRFK